jgi:NAD(P)-dependent dehydrogenase (short-subunit alcohol dehydrogenase family)
MNQGNYSATISLAGKVIAITGAAGLIGSSLTRHFLQQGATVAASDLNEAGLAALAAEQPAGNALLTQQLDITDAAACQSAVDQIVAHYGKLDVLVNNAAIDAKFDQLADASVNQSRFEHFPVDKLRKSVEVNLTGTVIMTQAACRQMLKQEFGNIINVASTYSVVAPNQNLYRFGDEEVQYKPVDYVASKSFIPNFTRYIATYYAKQGIRCNAIVPHGIFNNHPEKFLNNWAQISPMGRMCHINELLGPFTLLASDASSYMTGSIINVDGGWTAW